MNIHTQTLQRSTKEELADQVAQLEAKLAKYENIESNFTDGQHLYAKVGLEEAFRMAEAVRDLIGHLEPYAALKEGSLYFAMQLLEMLTPTIEDLNQLFKQKDMMTYTYKSA